MINNMIDVNESTKNAIFTWKSAVAIHSKSVTVVCFPSPFNTSKNTPNEITNDPKTIALAMIPAKLLEKYDFPKLISKNPTNGKSGTNQINSFIAIKI